MDAMALGSLLDCGNGSAPHKIDQELQFSLAQGHVNTFHRGWVVEWVRSALEALLGASQHITGE